MQPRHLSHQNFVVTDAATKQYRLKHALGTAAGDDGSGRTSLSKRGGAMGRKTGALGSRLGAGLMLAAMSVAANWVSMRAAAQGHRPPRQGVGPRANKCV